MNSINDSTEKNDDDTTVVSSTVCSIRGNLERPVSTGITPVARSVSEFEVRYLSLREYCNEWTDVVLVCLFVCSMSVCPFA